VTTTFLAGLGNGIARAEDRGVAGFATTMVLEGVDVRCLAVDPACAGILYAGTHGQGVLRSGDGGRTWQPAGLATLSVRSLAVAGPYVFAGTRPARLYRSASGGPWEELRGFRRIPGRFLWFAPAEPPTAYVQAIATVADDATVVVAGIEAGAVVRSADAGATWRGHRAGAMRDCHCLAAHPCSPGWFYEAGWGGGAVSSDGGEHWSRPAGLDRRYAWAVAADPVDPTLWYLSAAPGPLRAHSDRASAAIYRSRAGGPWQRLAGGLPDPLHAMPYVLIPGPAPCQLVAGLASGELWETYDAGETWNPLSFRFPRMERSLVRSES
jgi:photosystem II stability/assembly factor-like uncharacterized protein